MPPNKQEANRLELYKAGKLEERRSARPAHTPVAEEKNIEEQSKSIALSPEAMAMALMVIVLLILAALAI